LLVSKHHFAGQSKDQVDPVLDMTTVHGWPPCEQTNKLTNIQNATSKHSNKTKKTKTARSTEHANKKLQYQTNQNMKFTIL
jgi:hypothetical protein